MFNILRMLRRTPEFNPEFTPDFRELTDAPGWLFFEYGEFKHGLPHQSRFKINECRGKAMTVQKMPMWARNNGEDSYPIAVDYLPTIVSAPRGHIAGELYLVPTGHIPFIDKWRLNGVNFDRKMSKLVMPDGVEIRAFMYKGRKEIWAPWIDWDTQFYRDRESAKFSLIRPQRMERNSNDYYSTFTRHDLKESIDKCFVGILHGVEPSKPTP